ncbi:MAG TPA: hypothetical protein VJ110_01070 [Candidatus Nanoarchaeia archaeon]|nr:hypothetical protein [Candidatus Nanoarchaeia archaeon]
MEAYRLSIKILHGARFEPESAIKNIRNVISTDLRRPTEFPQARISLQNGVILVTGVPKKELEYAITRHQELSARVHGTPFSYSLEEVELSEKESGITKIRGELEDIITERDNDIESMEKRIDELSAENEKYAEEKASYESEIKSLKGQLKLARQQPAQATVQTKEVVKVVDEGFKVKEEFIICVIGHESMSLRSLDNMFESLGNANMQLEEALSLSKIATSDYITRHFGYDVRKTQESIKYLDKIHRRDSHNLFDSNCQHIDRLQEELNNILKKKRIAEVTSDYVKRVQDFGGQFDYFATVATDGAYFYVPRGLSSGAVTKAIRAHAVEALQELYSNVETQKGKYHVKIKVPGLDSLDDAIKALEDKDRHKKYIFNKLKLGISVVTFQKAD